MSSEFTTPLTGLADVFGRDLRRKRFVTAVLNDVARRHGYEPLEIPLIERATSFAEEVVGRLTIWINGRHRCPGS